MCTVSEQPATATAAAVVVVMKSLYCLLLRQDCCTTFRTSWRGGEYLSTDWILICTPIEHLVQIWRSMAGIQIPGKDHAAATARQRLGDSVMLVVSQVLEALHIPNSLNQRDDCVVVRHED